MAEAAGVKGPCHAPSWSRGSSRIRASQHGDVEPETVIHGPVEEVASLAAVMVCCRPLTEQHASSPVAPAARIRLHGRLKIRSWPVFGQAGVVTRDSAVRLPELHVIDHDGRVAGIGAEVRVAGPIDVEWRADDHPERQLRILSGEGLIGTADLRLVEARGTIHLEAATAARARHVRLEIHYGEELIAVTNPIFLEAA